MKDIKWNFTEGRVLEMCSHGEHKHEIFGLHPDRARELKNQILIFMVNAGSLGDSLHIHLIRAYEHSENMEEFMYCLSEIFEVQGKNELMKFIQQRDPAIAALILMTSRDLIMNNPGKS